MPEFNGDEFHPFAAQALTSGGLLDGAISTDDIKPTVEQYAIAAGDHVVFAASEAMMEQAFVVGDVLDPSEYQERYPDWIERIQRGYMLCRWVSHLDLAGDIGWFARGKMIPVSREERDQIEKWLQSGKSDGDLKPDFLHERYERYHDEHHALAPSEIAKSSTCGMCQSRDVKLVFRHHATVVGEANELTIEGKTVYVAIGQQMVECHGEVMMICSSCHATRKLEGEEFKFEPDSIVGQIATHPH